MQPENVILTDAATGSRAEVLAGFGFNCHRFAAVHDGRQVELLWAADNFISGAERPSGSGVPILFPFPGRIKGTTLEWEGREYPLRQGDGRGNAIHGFVHERPWRVLEREEQRVRAEFQASVDDPLILQSWPADFRIAATYELAGNELRLAVRVENPDVKPLPCGLGAHPYFRVPLGEAGSAEDCTITVPISQAWELADMNATGRLLPLAEDQRLDRGVPLAQAQFDNVFTGLHFDDGWGRSTITDQANQRRLAVEFDHAFRECVVYTPGHREAICIEPYTMVPDAFRLEREGIAAGLRVLAPGESFEAHCKLRLEPMN